MAADGYYAAMFARAQADGMANVDAAAKVADAFCDGRPAGKATARDRQAGFWSSSFLRALPAEAWQQEALRLALARYLAQDAVAAPDIVAYLAAHAPESLRWAARHSGLVQRQESPRWAEVEALASSHPMEFSEFVRVFHDFRQARAERVAEVERFRPPLAALTPLELLAYASLYAFEHIVPAQLEACPADAGVDPSPQSRWDAIEETLAWKLASCDLDDFRLDDATIGRSLRTHLAPFLLPSPQQPPRRDLYAAFSALVDAQVELSAFDARSADAFSYDDAVRFVLRGNVLEIDVVDPQAKPRWQREERKRLRLHDYWLWRGVDALGDSPALLARIGQSNFHASAMAMGKALGTWLCLQEVYGVEARIDAGGSMQVDVFNALLSIELMTAFYNNDFMLPYHEALKRCGHPWQALGMLAISGFAQGENRLPLTWSERAAKVARIAPWAATRERPQGHPRAAEAILDFWTCDLAALAVRLRTGEVGLRPRLQELPILGFGKHLVQLPWMQAMQANRVAAINNLRRLGANRAEARQETRRIEQRLGEVFASCGFTVLTGCELPASSDTDAQGEEIDLLCARDGCLLVLEVKSSYVRRSQAEATAHRAATLRKAGRQLKRKVATVRQRLGSDPGWAATLGLQLGGMPRITAWIVDTTIECDRESFDGFLKLSLEELLVALRDERHLLRGLSHFLDGEHPPPETLYPQGFTAQGFIEVIESDAVWAGVV